MRREEVDDRTYSFSSYLSKPQKLWDESSYEYGYEKRDYERTFHSHIIIIVFDGNCTHLLIHELPIIDSRPDICGHIDWAIIHAEASVAPVPPSSSDILSSILTDQCILEE